MFCKLLRRRFTLIQHIAVFRRQTTTYTSKIMDANKSVLFLIKHGRVFHVNNASETDGRLSFFVLHV